MNIIISLIVVIVSHCVHISKHQFAHLKHTQLLLINYSTIKRKKKKSSKPKLKLFFKC